MLIGDHRIGRIERIAAGQVRLARSLDVVGVPGAPAERDVPLDDTLVSVRKLLGRTVWLVGSATATAGAYLLLLGWNATKELTPEEPGAAGMECTGPYGAWQVVTVGIVLAALVVAGTWSRHEYLVSAACVATLTVLFTIDAITVNDSCSDNSLLPVGVLMVLGGSTCAALVLVVLTVAVRNRGAGGRA